MKMAVFWVVAPCRLVEVYRRFRGLYCLHHQGDETSITQRPDDAGSTDLWNVRELTPVYAALQPRRQPSSDPKVHYRVHNSLTLDPILSQHH
jgi:hypothetical protein